MRHFRQIKGIALGLAALLATAAVPAAPAHAVATDSLIEGAKQCTRYLTRYEREYGIPTHLLSAIASTESGRYHEGLRINIPWPWSINAQGKGYYFETKQEAVAMAKKLRAQGVKSFDVGCMQVNMQHHGQAFKTLDEAFEPQNNIAYAASFLRDLYQDSTSWKKAASDYHSKTPTLGKKYVGTVYDNWYQIIDKLRLARMQVPTGTEMAAAQKETGVKPVSYVSRGVEKPKASDKKTAAYKKPHMNSISLSKKEVTRERGILIVRPDISVVETPKATAKTFTLAEAKQSTGSAKVVHVPQRLIDATQKSGPRFVFSD